MFSCFPYIATDVMRVIGEPNVTFEMKETSSSISN